MVLRDIIMVRRRYFQELLAGNEGIASNILASRLRLLEAAEMITRRRDPDQAKRVLYEPTEKALDLLPVLIELVRWGMKYDPDATAPGQFVQRLAEDPDGLIADMRALHVHASHRAAPQGEERNGSRASARKR